MTLTAAEESRVAIRGVEDPHLIRGRGDETVTTRRRGQEQTLMLLSSAEVTITGSPWRN
jgi:hypothetical protein